MRRLAVAVMAALMLVACAPARPSSKQVRERPPDPAEWPSIEERMNGTLRVVGTLRRVELEGGFWVVDVDRPSGRGRSGLHVVTLFGKSRALGPVRAGDYVSVEGTRYTGPTIRMYGPEMTVRTVGRVTTPTVPYRNPPNREWNASFRKLPPGESRVSGYVVESHYSTKESYALLASRPPQLAGAVPVAIVRTAAGAVFDLARLQGIWVTADGAPDDVVPPGVSDEWRKVPIVLVEAVSLDVPPLQGAVPD